MSLSILSNASSPSQAQKLGALAQWSLEQEAKLSPKPALVDSRGDGAHADMTLSLLLKSAQCLGPWFVRMSQASFMATSNVELRHRIGQLGRDAEREMLFTTEGVNTHRGAIWALGLLVTAASTDSDSELMLFNRAAELARIPDPHIPAAKSPSKGQAACKAYSLPGAREQAQEGFPHLQKLGLPVLRQSRANGDPEPIARLNALLAIMTELTDTCVLSRAGLLGLKSMQRGAKAVLETGGCGTFSGRRVLAKLEQEMLKLNASAGGAADLLAATIFVDQLFAVPSNKSEE